MSLTKTGIPYLDFTWNPGGCGCSMGCDGCWAREKVAARVGRNIGCAACERFEVHWHPERIDAPVRRSKPAVIGVQFTGELFDPKRPREQIAQAWDAMFQAPQHTFVVLTHRWRRMARWVMRYASRCDFGWTDVGRRPVLCGDYRHLDDVYHRDICGWTGEEWTCLHPDAEANDGQCSAGGCPLCSPADTRKDLEAIELADEYTFDNEGFAEDCEWMRWYRRPRDGMLGNVWLGLTARTQSELERALTAAIRLRTTPHVRLWLSLEPLAGPMTFELPYYARLFEERGARVLWLKEARELRSGREVERQPWIGGVVIGCDNRPAKRFDLTWVRQIVRECRACGTPVYVKQLRIDGRLVTDPAEFPEDLRARQLPWTLRTKTP